MFNHIHSAAAVAQVQSWPSTGRMTARTIKPVSGGTELLISYFRDSDVVGKARQYGFFDASHEHHSVWTPLSLACECEPLSWARAAAIGRLFPTAQVALDGERNLRLAGIQLCLRDEQGKIPPLTVQTFNLLAARTLRDFSGPPKEQELETEAKGAMRGLLGDLVRKGAAQQETQCPPYVRAAIGWKQEALVQLMEQL
jgi:hypothetical protein